MLTAAFLWKVPKETDPEGPGLATLGESLFTEWAVPFEIASLVLLAAIIGAILLARNRGAGA